MEKVVSISKPRHVSKTFDARRSMIAKVHVAKKQLAMEEDSYRALLRRVTGKDSSADLSLGQLESVIKEFERLGFTGTARPAGKGGMPSDAQAKKIRALWLNLFHLGELENPSEEALIAYCRRMSGVQRIEWMHSEQFDNVIRGLRGWLQRVDWENPTAQTIASITAQRTRMMLDHSPSETSYAGIAAKAATIRAQYELIGMPLDGFAPELMPAHEMDYLIETLGARCRTIKLAQKDGK
jgi:hypothetical protein